MEKSLTPLETPMIEEFQGITAYQEEYERRYIFEKARREVDRTLAMEIYEESPQPEIHTFAQLLNSKKTPDRIEGLVPSGSTVVIVARAKTGKTTFALNLAKSLSNGTAFLNEFPTPKERGKIAYLNYEMDEQLLGSYGIKLGLNDDRVLTVQMRGKKGSVMTEVGRAKLAERLRLEGVTALIVDSFGQAFTGEDQNSNSEVLKWFDRFQAWARNDVGVNEIYVIVHTGKNESRGARGASAIEDVPDVIINLSLSNPENPLSPRVIEVHGRAEDLQPTTLSFDPATMVVSLGDRAGREGTSHQLRRRIRADVLAYVELNPGASTRRIKEDVNGSADIVKDTLDELVLGGFISRAKGPRNAFMHYLSQTGRGDLDLNP